jgi:hypothetical protein
MKLRILTRISAALLAAAGLGLPTILSAQSVTFYACQKNGKVIPGTIQVGDRPSCNGGASPVWWAQGSHARVLGGAVASDGDVLAGRGFTIVKPTNTVGQYKLVIRPGKLKSGVEPQLSVTPYGVAPTVSNPLVMGVVERDDGAWVFDIWMSQDSPSMSLNDQAFMFVLVQN